jgi:hypothetical protein
VLRQGFCVRNFSVDRLEPTLTPRRAHSEPPAERCAIEDEPAPSTPTAAALPNQICDLPAAAQNSVADTDGTQQLHGYAIPYKPARTERPHHVALSWKLHSLLQYPIRRHCPSHQVWGDIALGFGTEWRVVARAALPMRVALPLFAGLRP